MYLTWYSSVLAASYKTCMSSHLVHDAPGERVICTYATDNYYSNSYQLLARENLLAAYHSNYVALIGQEVELNSVQKLLS